MLRFTVSGSIHQLSLRGLAALLVSFNWICSEIAIAARLDLQTENWFLYKAQASGRPPLPRTMVLSGPSPDTERVAALFAALGSFDVFLAPPGDTVAQTAEKIDLENNDSCRSAAETLSVESIKFECIRRGPSEPLPGCSLGIDLQGLSVSGGIAQRAWVYAVLDNGEPCPFYDSLIPLSSYPFPGKPFRPLRGSRLVAEVVSPTPQSILRAIGIEPNSQGR